MQRKTILTLAFVMVMAVCAVGAVIVTDNDDTDAATYTYQIYLHSNGGDTADYVKNYASSNTTYDAEIPTRQYSRSGYTFMGWGTTANATTATYQPGDTVTMTSTATTTVLNLYAVWYEGDYAFTYVLSYDNNGGSGAPSSQTTTSTTGYGSFTIPAATMTKSGYEFIGWSTDSSATAGSYSAGDSFSISRWTGTASYSNYTFSRTLYAIWGEEYTYTLNYNANGGSGAPSTQTYTTTATSYTFTISSTVPTSANSTYYTFAGWDLSAYSYGGTDLYDPGDTITLTTSHTTRTLYAVWTTHYKVSYDANGGSGAPSAQTHDVTGNAISTSYVFALSSTEPTRTDYSFLGWAESASATSASMQAGDAYRVYMSDPQPTLYAVWLDATITYTYTLTYDQNGSYGATMPATQTYTTTDTSYTFTISSTVPTASGYVFGYYTVGSSSTQYQPGGTITLTYTSPSKELDAHWYVYNTFYLYYDANGGTGTPSTQSYSGVGTYHDFTVTSSQPTYDGHVFLGWSTASYDTYPSYYAGDTIRSYSSRTLYAIWGYTYTLNYDANGGTGAPSTQTMAGSSVNATFTISNTVPTLEGCTFIEWKGTNGLGYDPGDSVMVSRSSDGLTFTLTAVWGYTYTLTYNDNGGSGGPGTATHTTTYTSYSFTISATEPTRSGYIFLGWGDNSTDTTATYTNPHSLTLYSSSPSKTIYAVWATAYTYSLSFDANGGSGAPASQTYTGVEASHTFTLSLTEPTLTSYTFLGWSESGNASTVTYQPGDTVTLAIETGQTSAALTLKAIWGDTNNYSYVLMFDGNGGTGAPSPMTYSGVGASKYTFIIPADEPTKTNCTFLGWDESDTATSAALEVGDGVEITGMANNTVTVTLYAVWQVNHTYVYALYYDANGGTGAPEHQSYSAVNEATHTFTIPADEPTRQDYTFLGWGTADTDTSATYQPEDEIEITGMADNTITVTLYAVWSITYYTVTAGASDNHGAATIYRLSADGIWMATTNPYTYATYGMSFKVEALAIPEGYTFKYWSLNGENVGTATTYEFTMPREDVAITAHVGVYTHWSNDEHNASVSVLYYLDDQTQNYSLSWSADIEHFTGTVSSTDSSAQFEDTGYSILINVRSAVSGTTYSAYVSATLYDSEGSAVQTATYEIGKWGAFIVTLNVYNEYVSVTKVTKFRTFQSYSEGETYLVMDWTDSAHYDNSTVSVMNFSYENAAPLQQVVKTLVFLNTYGIVMKDPTLDVDSVWPSKTNIRVNFYSFALYGDSVTLNGITFPVTDATITIPYSMLNYKYYYDAESETTKTYAFTNIAFTWENGHAYITFNNDNIMYDLGEYTDRVFSFAGTWYFASGVYDYHTEQVKEITKDWSAVNFDFTAFGLILAFLLTLAGIWMRLKTKAHGLDYAMIIGGILLAIVISGGVLTT